MEQLFKQAMLLSSSIDADNDKNNGNATLSRLLFLNIIRIAEDNDIDIGNLFYWHICYHCGSTFKGNNSHLEEFSILRKWTRLNKGLYHLSSSIMSSVDKCKERIECLYYYLECSYCNRRIIMDHQPLPLFHDYKEDVKATLTTIRNIPISTKILDKKKLQLQKILSKNSSLSNFLSKK